MVSVTFGILSGVFHLIAYWLYSKEITRGKIKPNTASWSIWAFSAVLESTNYMAVTGDWVKNILPVACALSSIALVIYCLKMGHFKPLSAFDWTIVVLDSAALLVWWFYQSAEYANYLLVFTAVVSFIPIIRDTYLYPQNENATPWYWWSVAYLLLVAVVILRWQHAIDLLYPAVFFVLHLVIAILALDIRPRIQKSIEKYLLRFFSIGGKLHR